MKKIIIALLAFWLGIIMGAIITINNIRVDGVNELDYGVITLECYGQYFDYYYEREN